MSNALRSHFASSVVGGLVVAGGFLLLGITDRTNTQMVVEGGPVAAVAAPGTISGLTPNAIYRLEAPGVVYIRAKPTETVESPFNLFHQPESSTSTGSGFLVDRRGDILTAYHVVAGADPTAGVTVDFEGGITRTASVEGVDREADLAVLKVDLHGVPAVRPLPLGDSTSVRVGDPTLAIANPFGADRTLSSGIVSALQHQIEASDGSMVDNVIQTDQPHDPSSSGGPLLNASGRVIGINSQVAGTNGDGAAISFSTPINTADPVLFRVSHGGVRLAYIGVNGVSSRQSRPGLTVTHVFPRGPAAVGRLRPGDSIEKLDGITVSSMSELERLVMVRTPGQTVSLEIRRNGRSRVLDVRLGFPPRRP